MPNWPTTKRHVDVARIGIRDQAVRWAVAGTREGGVSRRPLLLAAPARPELALRKTRSDLRDVPQTRRALREFNEPDRPTGVIVITDVASGAERVLEATRAEQKKGARFHTMTFNTGHTWYHEGWSWAPDGRSLLVLENHRTRPWVVDIETDTVTELPWLADSMPSWQRGTERVVLAIRASYDRPPSSSRSSIRR